jgi:hypothetical protein
VSKQEVDRFKERAEEERKHAGTVRDPKLARACRNLADKYDAVAQAYERLGH